jgi:hypothetical protein
VIVETGTAWGVPNARKAAILFLPANTARQLVGISVGIGSNRRGKFLQIQMVIALGGYRPGDSFRGTVLQSELLFGGVQYDTDRSTDLHLKWPHCRS